MTKEHIGLKIKKLRASVGWSQSELARQSGVTSAAISQLEKCNRKPTLNVITKIANALNVSILSFTDESTINLTEDNIFTRRFSIIKKLKHEDQELILNIANRLLND